MQKIRKKLKEKFTSFNYPKQLQAVDGSISDFIKIDGKYAIYKDKNGVIDRIILHDLAKNNSSINESNEMEDFKIANNLQKINRIRLCKVFRWRRYNKIT